jgi:hypothetical protein
LSLKEWQEAYVPEIKAFAEQARDYYRNNHPDERRFRFDELAKAADRVIGLKSDRTP